jgi:hypothetical protein
MNIRWTNIRDVSGVLAKFRDARRTYGSNCNQEAEMQAATEEPANFDIEVELRRSFGVDLMRIDGIKIMTASTRPPNAI